MKEPNWVLDDAVLAIHNRQLAEHGGLQGVRDASMLESALNRPKNLFYYNSDTCNIFRIAASYAYGISKNHPFIDGNKRTALVVCLLFLELNRISLNATQEEKYDTFIKLADGNLSEDHLALWLENKSLK